MRWHALCGVGLIFFSLCGGITLSTACAAGAEAPIVREYRAYPGYHDYQGYRLHRGPEDDAPDRFTSRRGRKCQIRCERIHGSRDYRCHEYRC
jgi:hypothetical protein